MQQIVIPRKNNENIRSIVFKANKPSGNVVFCHGFKGFMHWGAWIKMAKYFEQANLNLWLFDHFYNGTTDENPMDIDSLSNFARNSISEELFDINAVINHIQNNDLTKIPLYLIGHSRGGANAIISAFQNTAVTKIVTWAATSTYELILNSINTIEWKKNGVAHVINTRTNAQLPMNYSIYEDYLHNKDKYNVLQAASEITCDALFIHGTNDIGVPSINSQKLAEQCLHAIYLPIEGANHTFGITHPWDSNNLTPHFLEVVQNTIEFFTDDELE